MRKLTGQQIRETWLKFFESKGHHIEKGANLIPYNDPSLLWINSGVAALKKYMDGSEVPPNRRITNVALKVGFKLEKQEKKICSAFKPVEITSNWYAIER